MNVYDAYLEAAALPGASESRLFGKPCFKVNAKAFVAFFQDCMVFKLEDAARNEALALKGATLFDPSGKNRPMKEWVQVPADHLKHWKRLAKAALEYVEQA